MVEVDVEELLEVLVVVLELVGVVVVVLLLDVVEVVGVVVVLLLDMVVVVEGRVIVVVLVVLVGEVVVVDVDVDELLVVLDVEELVVVVVGVTCNPLVKIGSNTPPRTLEQITRNAKKTVHFRTTVRSVPIIQAGIPARRIS